MQAVSFDAVLEYPVLDPEVDPTRSENPVFVPAVLLVEAVVLWFVPVVFETDLFALTEPIYGFASVERVPVAVGPASCPVALSCDPRMFNPVFDAAIPAILARASSPAPVVCAPVRELRTALSTSALVFAGPLFTRSVKNPVRVASDAVA